MTNSADPLPRELAPGLFWLGACLEIPYEGTTLHTYDSLYLLRGEHSSLLVEAGLPNDHRVVARQLDQLLASGPELRHIWTTHQETPHAGGVGRLLARYPQANLRGNVQDYHLFFPQYEERFVPLEPGEAIDLGGTEFVAVEAVIRDLLTTQWGYDTRRRALFPGDGFAYAHHHGAGQCGSTAEEVSALDISEMAGLFSDQSLTWARYTDMEPYVARLERLVDELSVEVVGPTHGLPITDVDAVLPRIIAGLRSSGGAGDVYRAARSQADC
jgi:flavorubredoxin